MEVPLELVCLSKCGLQMQPSLFVPRRETPLAAGFDKRRLSLLLDVFLKVDFFWWGGEKHILCYFLEGAKSDKPFVEFRLDLISRGL